MSGFERVRDILVGSREKKKGRGERCLLNQVSGVCNQPTSGGLVLVFFEEMAKNFLQFFFH
jgi:hypothetical protein